MIQLGTWLNVADNTGAKLIKCIQILRGTNRRYGRIGNIIVASVKEAEPRKTVAKKEVVRAVIIRQKYPFKRADGSYIRFNTNDAVIVDGIKPKGTRIFGPVPRELKEMGFNEIIALAEELV